MARCEEASVIPNMRHALFRWRNLDDQITDGPRSWENVPLYDRGGLGRPLKGGE